MTLPTAGKAIEAGGTTRLDGGLSLESGRSLSRVEIAWRAWGELSEQGDNAVLVCHALTGNADVDQWWPALLGHGRAFDPRGDFVIATNVLGGCAGSTGPSSVHPKRAGRFGGDFPAVTIRDLVQAQAQLLRQLGVRRLRLVVGGSMGGMQALEWAASHPSKVDAIAVIAAPGRHSPWAVAWSEAQRHALTADPRWQEGNYLAARPPLAGLAAARMIGMTSYRSFAEFDERFAPGTEGARRGGVRGWLAHHARDINARFDATSYVRLLDAMDSHDVSRGRGRYVDVLGTIEVPALVVGIDSDVLYPLAEQEQLARAMPCAQLRVLEAPFGHDSFLIATDPLDRWIREFRSSVEVRP